MSSFGFFNLLLVLTTWWVLGTQSSSACFLPNCGPNQAVNAALEYKFHFKQISLNNCFAKLYYSKSAYEDQLWLKLYIPRVNEQLIFCWYTTHLFFRFKLNFLRRIQILISWMVLENWSRLPSFMGNLIIILVHFSAPILTFLL